MNELSVFPAQLEEIAEAQQATGARLDQCVSEFARLLVAMKAQMDSLQKDLQSKVTITSAQARTVQEAVKGRSCALCEAKSLEYQRCGKPVREAIWRDLYKEFSIGSRYDLQAYKFQSALDFVDGWNSFSTMRKIAKNAEAVK